MTGNQEAFCQHRADGLEPSPAYIAAGYSANMLPATISNNAYMLAQDSDIVARIQELKQAVTASLVANTVWTKETLVTKAYAAYELAMNSKQPSAANGSVKLIAELTGMLASQVTPMQVTQVTIVLSKATPVVEGEVAPSEE